MVAAELGRIGGRVKNPSKGFGSSSWRARDAADQRWAAYYAAHPEKLKAKLQQEARRMKHAK